MKNLRESRVSFWILISLSILVLIVLKYSFDVTSYSLMSSFGWILLMIGVVGLVAFLVSVVIFLFNKKK
ncbi:MAG: hypothetical protein EVB02_00915 [SAR92 clade bacterium]|uniref:DUF3955 domain-containing protein n=1 Tax=SAR92 clade bacterium TaxID=2315479 RepID=A0A520LNM3_9GAMM|nr:MAG: hypothetical protein EVB02_00915 [SAR92 clade bacterium]